MRAKKLHLVLLLAVMSSLLFLAACGDDGDDGDSATTTETTTAETTQETPEAETEPGDSGQGGNAPAPSGDAVRSAKVEIADFAYDPDPVTIEVGGKVIWQNEDAAPHTATAEDGSFDTGTLEEGKLKSETFKEPGSYSYICTIHPEMHGTVEVVE